MQRLLYITTAHFNSGEEEITTVRNQGHMMASIMYRNKRVSVREAFCPRGCKKGLDSIHHVGSGSCVECVAFNAQNVLLQGITTSRLIALEDERSRTASTKIIPTPPTSPGKPNREIMGTIKDAQNFLVNSIHQQLSGIGAVNSVRLPDDDALQEAAELKRKNVANARALAKKTKKDTATQLRKYAEATQFDVEDTVRSLTSQCKTSSTSEHDLLPFYRGAAAVHKPGQVVNLQPCGKVHAGLALGVIDANVSISSAVTVFQPTNLMKVLEVGQSISIQNIEGAGRGIVSNSSILKSQYICHYDGDRVDATTGEILMRCKRTSQNINNLPVHIQKQLRSLEYVKNWAVTLNRGSNIKKFGGTRNIVIDGTIAASPILDYLVDRGLIGPGALMNSSYGTGKAPNCILIFVPWHQDNYALSNFFVPQQSEIMMAILVAKFDIPPNTELTWNYDYSSHVELPVLPVATPAARVVATVQPVLHVAPPRVVSVEEEQIEVVYNAPSASDLPQNSTAVSAMTVEEQGLMHHGDTSKRITSGALKLFVRSIHLITPSIVEPSYRLVNITNAFSQDFLQRWCVDQASRMKYSRENRVKTQMSARESVEAVMRMLTIFATEQTVREYYCQTRQIASQEVLDGHLLGIDSVFWIDMHLKFHNVNDFHNEFPFEHMPTSYQQKNKLDARIIDFVFPPPEKIANGLLKGMELLHGRKPSGFLDSFFSRAKLYQLWTDSLSFYRKADANWSRSGVAMSDPFYHYVLPVTMFDPNKPLQTCGVSQPTKRWESVAWFVVMLSPQSPLQPKRADLSPQETHH